MRACSQLVLLRIKFSFSSDNIGIDRDSVAFVDFDTIASEVLFATPSASASTLALVGFEFFEVSLNVADSLA
jgi:hypothetical protein